MTQPAETPEVREKHRRPVRNSFLFSTGGLAVGLTTGLLLGNSLAATAPAHTATGVVRCANGEAVSGIYVVAGSEDAHDATSGFVTPQPEPNNPSVASYTREIGTTTYTLHLGCGVEKVNGKTTGGWEDLGYLATGTALEADTSVGVECPTVMQPNKFHNTCVVGNLVPEGAPVGVVAPTAAN